VHNFCHVTVLVSWQRDENTKFYPYSGVLGCGIMWSGYQCTSQSLVTVYQATQYCKP